MSKTAALEKAIELNQKFTTKSAVVVIGIIIAIAGWSINKNYEFIYTKIEKIDVKTDNIKENIIRNTVKIGHLEQLITVNKSLNRTVDVAGERLGK